MLRDCSTAITNNPRSTKAYYRSALALVALERFEEAVDSCDRCLQFDPENSSVRALREKAKKFHQSRLDKERERLDRIRKQKEEKMRLHLAFKVIGSSMSFRAKLIHHRHETCLCWPAQMEAKTALMNHTLTRKIQPAIRLHSQCFSCIHNTPCRTLSQSLSRIRRSARTYLQCSRPRHPHQPGI